MGQKAAFLLVSVENDYFGTQPDFNEAQVDQVCLLVNETRSDSVDACELGDAIYPNEGFFALGVYDKGFFYGSRKLLYDSPSDYFEVIKSGVSAVFPKFQALIVHGYPSTNYFGYALYEGIHLIREYSGSMDEGITHDKTCSCIWSYLKKLNEAPRRSRMGFSQMLCSSIF